MHFLVTVAVLVYAPHAPPGAAGEPALAGTVAPLDQVRRQIEAAERARGATVVADPIATAQRMHAEGWTDVAELAFFARGAKRVADGRQALARVELADAERDFADAEAVYAPELWRPGAASEAATAALWRGVALFELGRRGEAEAAWRRAVALEPAAQLTEAVVRPEVARAFAAARRAPRPTATLTIDVPWANEVRVDRVARPAGAGAVTVGEHFVEARGADYLPYAAVVDVPAAGATVAPPLAMDEEAAAIAAAAKEPFPQALEALRDTLGVDEVVVASAAIDAGALALAASKRQAGCGTETVTAGRADELVQKLGAAECRGGQPVGVFDAPAIASPRPAAPSTAAAATAVAGGGPARPRLWQRPWLWVTVVGTVAVGVVLGATLWPRAPSYSGTVDFHQFALGAR